MEKDALGTQDPNIESESENSPPDIEEKSAKEEEFSGNDASVSLVEWMNLPRSSRCVAWRELLENFAGIEPLENHGTVELEVSLFHLALDRKS